MGRVKVSSVVIAVLAASLVGFWSWVLAIPVSVPDCPSRSPAGTVCLTSAPVRVSTILPLYREVLGLRNGIGPTYGVTVSGLPGGVRTVYLDRDGMHHLSPQPGMIITASLLHGKVERLSRPGEIAWVSGYGPGFRYGWIVATVVVALVLVLLARLDRREVRAPLAWRRVELGAAAVALGSVVAVPFAPGRAEMLTLVVCFGLLLAVETAGQHWQKDAEV